MRDLLLRLFNLEGVDFESAAGWNLRFLSGWAPHVVALGCLGLLLLVWQVYRREKGTATGRSKLALGLLRLLALAALVFVLLQPALVVHKSQLKESYVILLADKSDSMGLEDQYRDEPRVARLAYAAGLTQTLDPARPVDPGVAQELRSMSRAEIANRVLANPRIGLVERIARNCRVRQLVFAETVSEAPTSPDGAPSPDEGPSRLPVRPLVIVPDGPVTQLGECLRDAAAELRGQRIAAMVVLSDWCSNSGITPVEATRYAVDATGAPFPIFAVGVGDPAVQRDIAVAGVSANSVAFLNDPLVFNVALEQSGYDGATVPLELRIGDAVVARKDITLEPGRQYHTISHKPVEKGVFKYVVSIPKRDDELSGLNNAAEHTVTVKDDKVRVLLVAAPASWEWRYLKTALARDTSVDVSVWLQSAEPEWVMAGGRQLEQLPLSKKELVDDFDAIILLGASADAISNDQFENIRAFVGEFGGGLIFAASPLVVTEAFEKTPLAKCLPLSLDLPSGFTPASDIENSFKPRVTPEGWAHPAMRLVEDPHQNRELWDALPGFFWLQPTGKLKPGARALAVHPEEKSEHGPLPIFVEHRYGAGRVFFLATDETWRWRFLIGDKYFYRFWRQIISLTASGKLLGSAKRLTLAVARTKYTVGQKVEVLDEMLRPSGERFLLATLDLPGGGTQQVRLTLADPSQGIYRGSFVARKVGSYAVWMSAAPGENPETVPFSVTMSTLESESRRLDVETMNAVAAKTSGAAFTIDQVDQIPDRIKAESVNITTEHPTEIWDSWGCLLLFVIPLTCEWWLRKRRLLT